MEAYYLPQKANLPTLPDADSADTNLDNLLHLKARILRSKLEVLASEIYTRLNLWDRNLSRIDDAKTRVEEILRRFTQMANYHVREHRDNNLFHDQIFNLEAQRRAEDVACWRDIVLVMRDFLLAWEAHEHAKARAIFLQHAGPGLEKYL